MSIMFLGIGMVLLGAGNSAPDSAPSSELTALCQEAVENHPGLQARHAEWRAALERIPQVTSLDDPMFSYSQFINSMDTRLKVAIAQQFPWFGTLRERGEQAAAQADAVLAQLESERDAVVYGVKVAYYDYAELADQVRIARSQTELLDYVEEEMLAKYEYGLVEWDALLRVQVEQETLRDREAGLEALRPAYSARIDEAVGQPVGEMRPWPAAQPLPTAPPAFDVALAEVLANNPKLDVWDHDAESMAHEAELARLRGLPSVTLMGEYADMKTQDIMRPDRQYPSTFNAARRLFGTASGQMPADGANSLIDLYSLGTWNEPMTYPEKADDEFMVTLSLNIPLHRKRIRAGVEEARLRESAAKHEREATARNLEAETRMAHFELEDARRRHGVVAESILPKAQQAYEHLQTRLATGDVDVIDVLDAVRTLLQLELDQSEAVWDAHKAAARLEYLAGGPGSQPKG